MKLTKKKPKMRKSTPSLGLAIWFMALGAQAGPPPRCRTCPLPEEKLEVKVTKKVNLDFKSVADLDVRVANKYGTITLVPWAKDSVKMDVEITARGQTKAEAERILERVDVRYTHGPTALNVTTAIRQQETASNNPVTNTVQGLWNTITSTFNSENKPTASATSGGAGSPGLSIDQHNLQVNIRLQVPAGAQADLDNRYGDVALAGPLKGRLGLDIEYGNLRADHTIASGRISLKNGKATLWALLSGSLEAKDGTVQLAQGGDILLLANNSKVELDSVAALRLDTRYGQVQVGRAGSLSGKTYMTDLKIANLAREGVLEMQFGSLAAKGLRSNGAAFSVQASRTSVSLDLANLADYQLELTGRADQIEYPARLGRVEATKSAEWPNNGTVRGTVGGGKKAIKITNRDGSIVAK
jgi:hypothetical protein